MNNDNHQAHTCPALAAVCRTVSPPEETTKGAPFSKRRIRPKMIFVTIYYNGNNHHQCDHYHFRKEEGSSVFQKIYQTLWVNMIFNMIQKFSATILFTDTMTSFSRKNTFMPIYQKSRGWCISRRRHLGCRSQTFIDTRPSRQDREDRIISPKIDKSNMMGKERAVCGTHLRNHKYEVGS